MSVFSYKTDKSKYMLGDETDLTGIGDGTAFGAIKATYNQSKKTILTKTLNAGSESISFTNSAITSTALIDVYTNAYGVNPISITQNSTTVTLTFAAQSSAITVKLVVWEV